VVGSDTTGKISVKQKTCFKCPLNLMLLRESMCRGINPYEDHVLRLNILNGVKAVAPNMAGAGDGQNDLGNYGIFFK